MRVRDDIARRPTATDGTRDARVWIDNLGVAGGEIDRIDVLEIITDNVRRLATARQVSAVRDRAAARAAVVVDDDRSGEAVDVDLRVRERDRAGRRDVADRIGEHDVLVRRIRRGDGGGRVRVDRLDPGFVGVDDTVAVDVDVRDARAVGARVAEAHDDLGARVRTDREVQDVVAERRREQELLDRAGGDGDLRNECEGTVRRGVREEEGARGRVLREGVQVFGARLRVDVGGRRGIVLGRIGDHRGAGDPLVRRRVERLEVDDDVADRGAGVTLVFDPEDAVIDEHSVGRGAFGRGREPGDRGAAEAAGFGEGPLGVARVGERGIGLLEHHVGLRGGSGKDPSYVLRGGSIARAAAANPIARNFNLRSLRIGVSLFERRGVASLFGFGAR